MSENCRDFIGRLLDKNPKTRLGVAGSSEVMAHPWLSEIDVDLMLQKKLEPPMKPPDVEVLIQNLFAAKDGTGPTISIIPDFKMKQVNENADKFAGFDAKPTNTPFQEVPKD